MAELLRVYAAPLILQGGSTVRADSALQALDIFVFVYTWEHFPVPTPASINIY